MNKLTILLAAAAISAGSLQAQYYDPPPPVRGESMGSYLDRLNRYDGLYDAATGRHANGGILYQWIYGPADRRYNEKRAKIVGEMEAKTRADAVTAKSIHELDEEVMALRNLVLSGKASEADRELLKRKGTELRAAAAAFYGKR